MEITHLPFLEVVKDITSRFNKIPNKDFVNHGKYAIIDQGANIIAGYTNDETVITDLGYPLIVFGDHTRVLKYVNYPFAIGADGVKVLSVDTEKAYPLYVYYFLKFLKIPNAGYSRHFKFLKEKKIALPKDIDEQKRIAKVLSECEALIQKRKESIELLDELLRSTFLEMFGDSALNSKHWEKVPLKQFGEIITGNTPPRSNPENYSSNYIEWIKTDNIKEDNIYITTASEYLSETGLQYARTVSNGALLVACIAGSIDSIGRAALTNRGVSFNQQINAIQPNRDIEPIFLYWLFKVSRKYIQSHAAKGMKKILTKGEFEKIQMIKPPFELQTQFSIIANKIIPIKSYFQDSLKELENLYGSISQRAFKGELDLSKVDISDMENSNKKNLEEVKEDLTDEQLDELINSFEHTLPSGEVPSNRKTDIRNINIRQYLRLPDNEETEGMEFYHTDKDYFYQFILTKGFPEGTFTLQDVERYARNYILGGTGFEFTYDNWKTIIFRFIGASPPLIEQFFDDTAKSIKLKLTDEAFKV
ncbi:restriction endonuclease subunit S [Chryseobacterium oranimense]|uniref:restriction endonuclease subunit S n=1 Tax=Chryseobacterium oranimense TaxID=421058 RepID=UPI0031E25A91